MYIPEHLSDALRDMVADDKPETIQVIERAEIEEPDPPYNQPPWFRNPGCSVCRRKAATHSIKFTRGTPQVWVVYLCADCVDEWKGP